MLVQSHRREPQGARFVHIPVLAFLAATVLFACKSAPTASSQGADGSVQPTVEAAIVHDPNLDAVVTIDGVPVLTRGALNRQLHAMADRYQETPGSLSITPHWLDERRQRIVKDAIEAHLLDAYIAREALPLPSQEEALASLKAFNPHIFANEDIFQRYLVARNLSREQFLANEQRTLALHAKFEADDALVIAEEDIERYYRSQRDRLRAKERLLLSTITITLPQDAPDALVTHHRNELLALRQQIEDGQHTFEALARARSQGIEASQGGDLGWLERGDDPALIAANIERNLFQSPVGSITEPLRTLAGLQIFWIRARRSAGIRPLDEVYESMRMPLLAQRKRALMRALILQLQMEHSVLEYDDTIGYETYGD